MPKKRKTSSFHTKIYRQHHGSIPREENGRLYEIHHIDGDPTNNDINNLVAVTLQEHYDIHYANGDWAACLIMSERMKISPEEKSNLARKNILNQIENGTNPIIIKNANQGRGLDNENTDKTVYCFEHKDTGERVHMTRYEFYTKYQLAAHGVTGLVHGKHRSVRRWVLIKTDKSGVESSSDIRQTYHFKNKKTGEEVIMTQPDFVRKYKGRGISRHSIHSLVNGTNNKKSAGGWTLA